jgi:hypothetical protein
MKAPRAGDSGNHTRGDDNEQCGRHEQLGRAAGGDQPKQRAQQELAGDADQAYCQGCMAERQGEAHQRRTTGTPTQDRDQEQQRHDRQILR